MRAKEVVKRKGMQGCYEEEVEGGAERVGFIAESKDVGSARRCYVCNLKYQENAY